MNFKHFRCQRMNRLLQKGCETPGRDPHRIFIKDVSRDGQTMLSYHLLFEYRQQALKQFDRAWGAPSDVEVNRHDANCAASDGVASSKDSAIDCAIARGDHPLGFRHGIVGPLQRFAHVSGYRACDEQHIGVAR